MADSHEDSEPPIAGEWLDEVKDDLNGLEDETKEVEVTVDDFSDLGDLAERVKKFDRDRKALDERIRKLGEDRRGWSEDRWKTAQDLKNEVDLNAAKALQAEAQALAEQAGVPWRKKRFGPGGSRHFRGHPGDCQCQGSKP